MKVRKAKIEDGAAIARVVVDTWKSAYRGIVPDEYLDSLSYDERENLMRDTIADIEGNTFLYVIEDDERKIIGFTLGGDERSGHNIFRGEIFAIYVEKKCQGKNAGRMLVQAAVTHLRAAGIDNLLVWTFAQNPYRKFYDSLGGKVVDKQVFEMDGIKHDMVAYGWENTLELITED